MSGNLDGARIFVLGVVLFVTSLIMFCIVGVRNDERRRTRVTWGRIVDAHEEVILHTGFGRWYREHLWCMTVAFTDASGVERTIRRSVGASRSGEYPVGGSCRVSYEPDKPGNAQVVGTEEDLLVPVVLLSVFFVLMMFLAMFGRWR